MIITSSYGVKVKDGSAALHRTAAIFSDAVAYLIAPVTDHWNELSQISQPLQQRQAVEHMVHSARGRTASYDFDDHFPKFPSYYMRAAIAQALGIVSAYQSQLKIWKDNRYAGQEPKIDSCAHRMPALYRGNTYKPVVDKATGEIQPYMAQIKVYQNHDWIWMPVRLCKSDVDYLTKRGRNGTISAPVLEKRPHCGNNGSVWKLRFSVTETVDLATKLVYDQKICAVDLGLTTDATCSVLNAQGTVLAREFIKCGREQDQVRNALHRISVFQRLHGPHDTGHLWNCARNQNRNLAHQVSRKIIDFAIANDCDVIVFEHLNMRGRKHGSRRQKLAMWKHADIQNTVERLAHHYGMRVSHVNAWNTSRLAYDGSGKVKRGRAVSESTPYDVCQFSNGKMYNCDLSASYNIGARYFIRELLKELPHLKADVPEMGSGTRRTLADLWKLNQYIDSAVNC